MSLTVEEQILRQQKSVYCAEVSHASCGSDSGSFWCDKSVLICNLEVCFTLKTWRFEGWKTKGGFFEFYYVDVLTNSRKFRKSRKSVLPSSEAQGMMLEWSPSRGPYLHPLHSPSHRNSSFSCVFPEPRSVWVGTIWQTLAREKRPYSSLSLPVGEIVCYIQGGTRGRYCFAAEVFFHLSMVKTCEFLADSNVLNICTKPFIENVAQRLLLQLLSVWDSLSSCPFSLPQ